MQPHFVTRIVSPVGHRLSVAAPLLCSQSFPGPECGSPAAAGSTVALCEGEAPRVTKSGITGSELLHLVDTDLRRMRGHRGLSPEKKDTASTMSTGTSVLSTPMVNPRGAICFDCTERLRAEVWQLRQTLEEQSQLLKMQAAAMEAMRDEFRSDFQNIKNSLLLSQAPPSAVPGSRDEDARMESSIFVVRLMQTAGCELGLELDESTLTVMEVDPSGLVADWNRANSSTPILPGSRILSVNGETGVDRVLSRLIQDHVLEIALSRH